MLVVGYMDSGLEQYDQTYHVGAGRIRESVQEHFSDTNLIMVQADGDELELIRQQFTNIPMTNNRVVKWKGEIALFITDNLNLY